MKSKLLLKPFYNGFNYNSVKEIETLCSAFLENAQQSDSSFLFIIRQTCFEVCGLIESISGVAYLHDQIEQSLRPALTEMIKSLDDEAVSSKLNKAHNLINTLRHVKIEIHNLR